MLLFLEWSAVQWEIKSNAREDTDLELSEGLAAYAAEQAALQRTLASNFKLLWNTPLANVDNVLDLPDPPIVNSNNTPSTDNGNNGDLNDDDLDDDSDDDEPNSNEEEPSDLDD